MRRLAVMAHFDHAGEIAPHVRHQVQSLAADIDDVIVVTTARLSEPARAFLRQHAQVIERTNEGYDFYSYKVGLDSADLTAYDEVLICNDSYVGPLRGYAEILAGMDGTAADFWGFTLSQEIHPHLQSFFVVFRRSALVSEPFLAFWREMEPVSERMKVIRRYEVGMTRRLVEGGLVAASYFEATEAEERLARRRLQWFALHRERLPRSREDARRLRRRLRAPYNPCAALADAALDGARLPLVKLDTLRYDPYGLDAGRLLTRCEAAHPDAFAGVREYLAHTESLYPSRPETALRPTPRWLVPWRRRVRYGLLP